MQSIVKMNCMLIILYLHNRSLVCARVCAYDFMKVLRSLAPTTAAYRIAHRTSHINLLQHYSPINRSDCMCVGKGVRARTYTLI